MLHDRLDPIVVKRSPSKPVKKSEAMWMIDTAPHKFLHRLACSARTQVRLHPVNKHPAQEGEVKNDIR